MKTNRYSPKDVAFFMLQAVKRDEDLITHERLQLLVFYAQAYALAMNERPLFEDDFEAWPQGPVLPCLYNEYKQHGSIPIELTGVEVEFFLGRQCF